MDIATSKNGGRALKVFYVLLVLFLYAPIAMLVVLSFNDYAGVPNFPLRGFTARWYTQFLSNPELTASLRTSAVIAAIASVLCVVLGLLASIVLVRRRFFGKSAVSAFLLTPLVIPYVVFGISLLIFFNRVDRLPFVEFPLSIWTVAIGHAVIFFPFTILVLAPRLERIDVRLEEAARDLGAGALRTFWSITLPLILPAIISSFLITFTFSFDEFAVANFVVGDQVTFPIYLFSQLRFPTLLPQAIAVAVVVFVLSLLIVIGAEIGRRVVERRLDAELVQSAPAATTPAAQPV